MKLNARNGDYGLLYDANSNQIHYVIECDTETGEVSQYIFNEHGQCRLNDEGDLMTETHRYTAPLHFIRTRDL